VNATPPPGPRRSYWLLAVLAVLLVVPAGLANGVLLAAVLGTGTLSIVGALVARRAGATSGHSQSSAVLLGSDAAGSEVLLGDRELSAHGLILGASGAGKTTTLLTILTEQIRRGGPVVAIDMKGSPAFAEELARAAGGAGRRFRCWTMDGAERWNPLAHGNATELKDKLIATERFTEPHYQRAAERYVQTVLNVLGEVHPDRPPTLEEVVGLMDPGRLGGVLRGLPKPSAERVQDYLAGLTPDQLSAVRGLGTRLAIVSESHTGRYLTPGDEPGVDLRAALSGDEVVLFSLNSSTYGKLAAQIGTLVVQDLVTAAGHRLAAAESTRATIGIDEFSALGAENVISLLARGRESGLCVLLATQELADLDRTAPGLRDQVLGNTAIKIAHRQDVPASAQTIAQIAGTERTWEQTYQIGRGPLGRFDTSRGTQRQVEQFIVHPNEIKALPTGHAVLITKQPVARARTIRVAPPAGRVAPPARRDPPALG